MMHDDWTLYTNEMKASIGIRPLKTSVYLATLRTRTAETHFLNPNELTFFEGLVCDWCASSV